MGFINSLLSIWIWISIFFVSSVGNFLQFFIFLVTAPFDQTRRFAGRWFRLMAVLVVKLSPLWKFGIHGPYPNRLGGPMVVVSNHVSHMDCFLLSHLPWEMKYLTKSSLFKIPFIGWAMFLAGDIKVVRGTGNSVVKAMEVCREYLRRGMSVCIFPEGTRSMSDVMLPFKDGAFRLAIETQTPILPLAVAGTRRALPKHSWRFDFSRALVKVGDPISTVGMEISQVEELKQRVRDTIESMVQEIRPLTSASVD